MTPGARGADVVAARRRLVHRAAVGLLGAIAVLYLVVFFIQLPHLRETDNPAPAYAALALVYVALALVVALRDTARVHWTAAAVQVLVVVAFFWLLALLYREGDEQFILDMQWLAVLITAAQFLVLGLLVQLAQTRPR